MVRPAFTDVTSSSRFAPLAVLRNGEYLVSSETEPSIRIYDRNGVQIASLPIPAWFAVTGVTGQVIVVGYGSKGRAVIAPVRVWPKRTSVTDRNRAQAEPCRGPRRIVIAGSGAFLRRFRDRRSLLGFIVRGGR